MADLTSIPDAGAISKASELDVLDVKGDKVKFGSIIEADSETTIVAFIRHFFCGSCQAYVVQLASVRQEALKQANTKLVVIGCGDWSAIQNYAETTGFRGPIFADPTRELYHALGMDIENLRLTPAGQEERSYITHGFITRTILSIWRGPLKNPRLIGKQGNLSQLGGEFVFGPGKHCSFASRMQHTVDHVEVADLMKSANVEFP